MSFVFSVSDSLRKSVESASGGLQTVLYDDLGNPSVMNIIPAFNLEDIDSNLGTGLHPAFIVNGVTKSEIFVGTYQAYVYGGRAYSLPGMAPKIYVTYDQARDYCAAKGAGWHLMTMHEWAAVTLWCLKNGFQPRGNTSYGKSHEATYEHGRCPNGTYTLTGSGPVSWNHDNTTAGIADLVGNIWEWMHLLKLVDGKIYCPDENSYDLAEADWPDTGVRFDSPVAGDGVGSDNLGEPILSDIITNYGGPQGDDTNYDYNYDSAWNTLNLKGSWDPPVLMKQLCISPKRFDGTATVTLDIFANTKGVIWTRNYGTRFPLRGGSWSYGAYAGLGALNLNNPGSYSDSSVGFRPALLQRQMPDGHGCLAGIRRKGGLLHPTQKGKYQQAWAVSRQKAQNGPGCFL